MLSFSEEKALFTLGFARVAGIDEVGRGPLAGPVLAAAVVLPQRLRHTKWAEAVRDSKLLTPARRQTLFSHIQETALSIGVGMINSQTIDLQGIAKATRLAMVQAIKQITPPPDFVLIDYVTVPELKLPQKGVKEGDSICFSIACASIIAKVTRDHIMSELDTLYPGYGFADHKGYGTREHLECLNRLGPCPIHRRSFQPVKEAEAGA